MPKLFLFIILLVMFGSLHPLTARAEAVVNNISHSQLQQYILINCFNQQCYELWQVIQEQATMALPTAIILEDKQDAVVEQTTDTAAISNLPVVELVLTIPTSDQSPPLITNNQVAELKQNENPVIPVQTIVVEENNIVAPVIVPKQIRINEVMATPAAGQSEWVELFNTLDEAVIMDNWQLVEGAGKVTILSSKIAAGAFLIVAKDSLNNIGDTVVLKNKEGVVIDSVSYGDWDDGNLSNNVVKTNSGQSIILWQGNYLTTDTPTPAAVNVYYQNQTSAPENKGVDNSAAVISSVSTPSSVTTTPAAVTVATSSEVSNPATTVANNGAESIEPAISFQFSDQVRLNEFLVDPAGSDEAEWIEIYNASGKDLNLLGWSLDDGDGGSAAYKIQEPIIVKTNDFLIFKREETGIVLNNSADAVVLRDPQGTVVSRFDYQNAKENYSFAYFDDGWQETTELTPARQNKKSSLQVSLYQPKLTTETKLTIKQKQNSSEIIETKKDLTPLLINSTELTAALVARLVQIQGELVEKKSNKLIIADDRGEFVVHVARSANLKLSAYSLGDQLAVRGKVRKISNELRIQPVGRQDIRVVSTEQPSISASLPIENVMVANHDFTKMTTVLLGLLFVIVAVNGYLAYQHREILLEKIKGRLNCWRQMMVRAPKVANKN